MWGNIVRNAPSMGVVLVSAVLLGVCASGAGTSAPIVRIGLVADNHYDTFPVGEKAPWQSMKSWFEEQRRRSTTTTKRRYDVAKDKMLEAISVFNRMEGTTFIVNLGDLVNNDVMWNLRPILDAFNTAKAPHFSILGNHDLRAHNDRFGKNNKTQEQFIRQKLGLGDHWYYSFALSAFRFIFLDSMLLDEKHDPKRRELVTWLESELQAATAAGQAAIIFGHISIGLNTNSIGPTIKACPHVVAAFFGHEHKGGYTKQGHVHTVILNGQIETLTNAFAVMDVFADRLELTGFGRVPTRVLPFSNPDTLEMVRQTLAKEGAVPSSGAHDLSHVGHTPAPPEQLWGPGDGQEQMPPLQLDIPTYRKPKMMPAEPNPGQTVFIHEYKSWPQRVVTHAPEDPVDLTDGTNRKGTWLAYPLDSPQDPEGHKRALAAAHAERKAHAVVNDAEPATQKRGGVATTSSSAAGLRGDNHPPTAADGDSADVVNELPAAAEDAATTTSVAPVLRHSAGARSPRDATAQAWSSMPVVTLLTVAVGAGAATLVLRRRGRR